MILGDKIGLKAHVWSSFGAEIRTAPMTHTLLDSRHVASPAGARLCSASTPKIARKLGYFGDDVGLPHTCAHCQTFSSIPGTEPRQTDQIRLLAKSPESSN